MVDYPTIPRNHNVLLVGFNDALSAKLAELFEQITISVDGQQYISLNYQSQPSKETHEQSAPQNRPFNECFSISNSALKKSNEAHSAPAFDQPMERFEQELEKITHQTLGCPPNLILVGWPQPTHQHDFGYQLVGYLSLAGLDDTCLLTVLLDHGQTHMINNNLKQEVLGQLCGVIACPKNQGDTTPINASGLAMYVAHHYLKWLKAMQTP